MGRVGKFPIHIPEEVKVTINEGNIKIEGPKGMLERKIPPQLNVVIEDSKIKVLPKKESKANEAIRGTIRALINNMVIGVTQGYQKVLLIDGQGYRASLEGKNLVLQIGYPHPIKFTPPSGIQITVPSPQSIMVHGINKELVGNVAAIIRKIRKHEPYKGKGIRYEGEVIRRKPGKKAGYETTGA
jgi:large subunit ribosomal protein L6